VAALLDEGFDEVPPAAPRHYRRWRGAGDTLAANELLCPVCRPVIRSAWELRTGDRLRCLPCISELEVLERHLHLEPRERRAYAEVDAVRSRARP
jgi:hypothetical protein